MTETTTCTAEKLLAGFSRLSTEDQEKVRQALGVGVTAGPGCPCCDPTAMMQQMLGKRLAGGSDPGAACKEMGQKV